MAFIENHGVPSCSGCELACVLITIIPVSLRILDLETVHLCETAKELCHVLATSQCVVDQLSGTSGSHPRKRSQVCLSSPNSCLYDPFSVSTPTVQKTAGFEQIVQRLDIRLAASQHMLKRL